MNIESLKKLVHAIKSAVWSSPTDEPPLWQLVPDEHGTYTLQRWNPDISVYWTEATRVRDQKEANIIIERLTRPPIIR